MVFKDDTLGYFLLFDIEGNTYRHIVGLGVRRFSCAYMDIFVCEKMAKLKDSKRQILNTSIYFLLSILVERLGHIYAARVFQTTLHYYRLL